MSWRGTARAPAFTGTSDPWPCVLSPYLQIKAEIVVKQEKKKMGATEVFVSQCREPARQNLVVTTGACAKAWGSQLGPFPACPQER